jgi:hypothetical protein
MRPGTITNPRCFCGLAIGLAVLLAAGSPAQQDSVGANSNDPLTELNSRFRAAYAQARKELLAKQGPIIIADGESLVLLRGGKRSEVKVTAKADIVKPVGHTPLAIYTLLVAAGDGELREDCLKNLRSIRELIAPATKSLEGHGLPDDILTTHQQILNDSAGFIDEVLANKKVTAEALKSFTRKMGPLLLSGAAYAATTQLDEMHKQVMAWKADMSATEWQQLRVLIPGSSPPRKDNLRTQYFSRLLGEKGEGERIIYAEALFDESRALNLLGSYQLDTGIGADFFNDPARMHRDLLADGAAAHLKKMNFD